MSKIVYGSRSPFREEIFIDEKGNPKSVQVADYRIVVCHDDKCPGLEAKGHELDGLDRSHHHDFRFTADARPEAKIIAEVKEMEAKEADETLVVLDLKGK